MINTRITRIKLRKSFSARLSLGIAIVVAAVFSITSVVYYRFAYNVVHEDSVEKAHGLLSNTIMEIDKMLYSVEVAVKNTAWTIVENLDNPEYMYSVTERLLDSNPFIYGSAVAFDPYYYGDIGLYYSPYSFRDNGKIKSMQLGSEDYDYHHMEWYQLSYLMRKPYWNEPYFDARGGEAMMITYSYPVFDQNGDLFGILTADVSLQWLTDQINSIQPYPDSYNFMLGRGGTYLVHKNNSRILNETIFIVAHERNDKNLVSLGRDMLAGNIGNMTINDIEGESFVFYAPIQSTGWSVAVVCPYKNVFANIYQLGIFLWITAILGLLIMIIFCYTTIKKQTAPLNEFAKSAEEISKGNFSAELPVIKSKDEMKKLHDSFRFMQKSLVEYIDELQYTTANKERIESELRIASNIQMNMVPKTFPPFPDRKEIKIYATINPAREVGGDLYDFFIEGDRFFFIIGDVSGKGVPASLVMAVTCRLFRTVASYFHSAAEIINALNNSLYETNEANMFVTFFIGILNLKTGRLQYCNGGHNPPIIISPEGKVSYMDIDTNIPIGVLGGYEYTESETVLPADSSILLYTDGVTEAENASKKLYTEERLIKIIKSIEFKDDPEEVIGTILNDVKKHCGDAEQSDDITILNVYYNPNHMKKQLVFKNDISEMPHIVGFIDEIAEELSLPEDLVFNLNLALEEAVANVINYAYPDNVINEISLTARLKYNNLIFTLTDSGEEFDPTQVPDADITLPAEERAIGGLGIFLIRNIMNDVKYQRIEGKNVFTLTKKI